MKNYLDKKYNQQELKASILKQELLLTDNEFHILKNKYSLNRLFYSLAFLAGIIELEVEG